MANGCYEVGGSCTTDTHQLKGPRDGWNSFIDRGSSGISALWRDNQALILTSDNEATACGRTEEDLRAIEAEFGITVEDAW